MENFEASIYRKGLASSLNELRADGEEGKQAAKDLLKGAKEATLYSEAKKRKQEMSELGQIKEPQEQRSETSTNKPSQPEILPKNEHNQREEELSVEQIEQKIVEELLTLVETNPHVTFSMSVYGMFSKSSYYKGSEYDGGLGSFTYVFNAETQQFTKKGIGDPQDPRQYCSDGLRIWRAEAKLYQPTLSCKSLPATEGAGRKWWGHVYTGGMLQELRGGVPFVGGLFVPSIDEVEKTYSPEMKTHFLQNWFKPESARILWKFFCAAFQKYDPKEWSSLVAIWERKPGNEGKKIEDSFNEATKGIF